MGFSREEHSPVWVAISFSKEHTKYKEKKKQAKTKAERPRHQSNS